MAKYGKAAEKTVKSALQDKPGVNSVDVDIPAKTVFLDYDETAFSLAGDLYSLAFYQQAFRVLKHHGRIFHYIGDPESRSSVARGSGWGPW